MNIYVYNNKIEESIIIMMFINSFNIQVTKKNKSKPENNIQIHLWQDFQVLLLKI